MVLRVNGNIEVDGKGIRTELDRPRGPDTSV